MSDEFRSGFVCLVGRPNTGKLAAIGAAAALGCGYVLPAWPAEAPRHLSDFNDLRQWREGRV